MQERNTIQKTLVLDALCALADHPTADEVAAEVQRRYPGVSRATVYRILNQAADSGTVYRVKINNGADHFDHQVFPHYHIHCSKCGKVDDVFTEQYVPKLTSADAANYIVTGHSLQFDGICPACQKKYKGE